MISYEDLNERQKQIINEIFECKFKCVFLSGLAGTGKSEVIKHLKEKMEANGVPYIVCATTGTAAKQAGGITLHSALRRSPDAINKGKYVDHKKPPINKFQEARYIFIDEVSMLEERLYKALLANMNKDQTVICVGDLNQLPVVKGERKLSDEELLRTMFFFFVGEELKPYILTEVVRQGDEFAQMLTNLALKGEFEVFNDENQFSHEYRITESNEEHMQRRIASQLMDSCQESLIPYIAATNEKCDVINRLCVKMLSDAPSKSYKDIEGHPIRWGKEYTKKTIEIANNEIKKAELNRESERIYTLGEVVMFTTNKSTSDDQTILYAKGSFGKVVALCDDYVIVKLWDDDPDKRIEVKVGYSEERENIVFTDENGFTKICSYKTIKKIPLIPGYAITAHRAQGLTVSEAFVDPQGSFECGQVYTMLSRVKTKEGLHFVHPIEAKDVKINPYAVEYHAFVQENGRSYNKEELELLATRFVVKGNPFLGLKEKKYLKEKEEAIKRYNEYWEIAKALCNNGLGAYFYEVTYDLYHEGDICGLIDQMMEFNEITPEKDHRPNKDPRLPAAIVEAIRRKEQKISDDFYVGKYDDILDVAKYGYPLLEIDWTVLDHAEDRIFKEIIGDYEDDDPIKMIDQWNQYKRRSIMEEAAKYDHTEAEEEYDAFEVPHYPKDEERE